MGKRKQIYVSFTDEIREELEKLAKQDNRPFANYIEWICIQHLDSVKKNDGLANNHLNS